MSEPETITLTVKRYRTPDGKPTCARHVPTGAKCRFLATWRYGTCWVCRLNPSSELWKYTQEGYLEPEPECPVWPEEARG